MAKTILVANWKNHPGSLDEAKFLIKNISKSQNLYKKLSFFIAPPAPYLDLVSSKARSFSKLASQDITSSSRGTFTGRVTPDILKSFGVRLSIIGHSESRALGETSEEVSKKIKVAVKSGIAPIVCVGERVRDADGEHFEFLRDEIKHSLANLSRKEVSGLIIAYEPVWAIGKEAEDALEPADLSQSVIFIRKVLTDIFGRQLAESTPIIYGGSVEPANAQTLFEGSGIRGFLVGHVSLDAKKLKTVAESLI